MTRVLPYWYRSAWPMRILVGIGACAVIALVAIVIFGAQERNGWVRDRDDALGASAAAAESLASERALRFADSLRIVDLQARMLRTDSEKRVSDSRRRLLADSVAQLRSQFTALADSSTPSDSVWVLLQLVHGLDAQNDELERRITLADSATQLAQNAARVFQEGRDRAIAQVEQQASVIAQQKAVLARADPPCRFCPSRKASFVAGVAAVTVLSIVLAR